jgi:hypothetical protein
LVSLAYWKTVDNCPQLLLLPWLATQQASYPFCTLPLHMHAVICASSVLRLVMDCSLSRPIIGPCCRFCRRCRIPHCPIVSSQHCFVKSWAIHRPSPQLSSAYCRASCCVLSHTHAADFRYCHVSYHPVATIQQCFSSAYSLMDFNPVTNLPHQKEVDVLIKPSLKHLCPSLHHFSQFK